MLENTQQLKTQLTEISQASDLYPREWLGLSSPPKTLYALGNTGLLKRRKLAVVGSRRTPLSALKLGTKIAEELSHSLTLVTGAADGGDTSVIEGALQGSGEIICLLAGGFSALPQASLPLLERVIKRGLILSPHDFDTPVRVFSYEYRNELLAAFCEGVFVLGAGEKSGALITAKYAKQMGKPIFALPYAPNTAAGVGCNALIKEGGRLTECAEDITSCLGIELKAQKQKPTLTPEEERVYEYLREAGETHASVLAQQTQVPAYKLRALLSSLEVKGLVVSVGGNRYLVV